MSFLKIILTTCSSFLIVACSSTAPDYTGQWEQIDDSTTVNRILTIAPEGENYTVIDEIKDTSTGEITYDEKSTGTIDGTELLTGTNTFTNVLNIEPDTKHLIMKTYDQNTLKFVKIN